MFGAFKPSTPLSGGLLWKIPWRMSTQRKLRHRRRLRRVDNVVSILDTALRRAAGTLTQPPATPQSPSPTPTSTDPSSTPKLDPAPTASAVAAHASPTSQSALLALRRGRGPKRGDILPLTSPHASFDLVAPLGAGPVRTTGEVARALGTIKGLERWKADMPREEEMRARDKYTVFDRKVKGYRKGVHKAPKWTRTSQRLNPPGY